MRSVWETRHLYGSSGPGERRCHREVRIGPGRGGGSFEASVSPARTPEPDVRVPTHPALCEFVSLGYATVASARVHGVGICPPR
jgi:hypothetical protein